MLRALLVVCEVDAWSRDGSNQASSGHVELSDSDMYNMEKQIHEVAWSGWSGRAQTWPNLVLCPHMLLCVKVWANRKQDHKAGRTKCSLW